MSRAKPDRFAEQANRKAVGPFGTPAPGDPASSSATLADAVRRCRWIAIDINAAAFALFFVGVPGEGRRLVFGFDSDFPAQSAASRQIGLQLAEEAAQRASRSTMPIWWPPLDPARCATFRPEVAWLDAPVVSATDDPGIMFPVFADRGQTGLVVFHGPEIAFDEDVLLATHARSFALFATVTRLKPMAGGRSLSISKRELECLRLTANGMTSEQIAVELGLSVHTANQYLTNTAQKLNAVNRMHAVAKALRLGLFD